MEIIDVSVCILEKDLIGFVIIEDPPERVALYGG